MKDRLLELDAMRGIAALAVVLFHFTINKNGAELGWQFSYGVTGVDIFFMISGFVIFLTINHTDRWQGFVTSRFSRLYPTYWVCVLFTTAFVMIYEPDTLTIPKVLANLTMFPSYFGMEDLDGSYWTLLIELWFYFWILMVYVSGKLKNIIEIGFILLFSIIAFHFFGSYYPKLYLLALQKVHLINHFPLFLSGIIFYKIKYDKLKPQHIVACAICILASIYLHDKGGRTMYILGIYEHSALIIFYHIIFVLFVAGKLAFLNIKPLLFLGKISYSLYLLHQYIGLNLIESFRNLGLGIYPSLFICLAICIALAWLVTTYIEIPAVRYIRKKTGRERTTAQSSSEKKPALHISKTGYLFQ
ncbi:MAG TPA: acyltransferase [Dyadobacter sp.]|nr:acyltransferase [Dyadobacter sp.]